MPAPQHPSVAERFGALPLLSRIAAVVLVALGLSVPFDSSCGWVAQSAWSAFAMVAALVQLWPAIAGGTSAALQRNWLIGAVGAGALLLHWLLIVLPSITSNAGFCLTLGAAAATAGCLLSPGRRW